MCVPGQPCFSNPTSPCDSCNGATTFFFQNGCAPNFTLCSTNVLYCGTNLTVSGINNGDNLTIALQKIDNVLSNAGITLTTIGTSGPATLISGILNVPNYTGGGITNSAAVNELMKSDGTNAVPSGIFSTSLGSAILGSASISGDRTISTFSSSSNSDLIIDTKLSGIVSELFRFTTNPNNGNSAIKIPLGGLSVMGNTNVTNIVASGLNIDMTTSGTPANGFGTGINFSTSVLSGKKNIGFVQALIEDITNGSEKSALRFSTMTGGSSPTEVFRFSSFGGIGIGGANFGTLGQVLTSGGPSGTATWTTVSGSSPAGSNTQVQYNNSGSFGASSNFRWDNTNRRLFLGDTTTPTSGSLVLAGGSVPTIDGEIKTDGNGILYKREASGPVTGILNFILTNYAQGALPYANNGSATTEVSYSGILVSGANNNNLLLGKIGDSGAIRTISVQGSASSIGMTLATKAGIGTQKTPVTITGSVQGGALVLTPGTLSSPPLNDAIEDNGQSLYYTTSGGIQTVIASGFEGSATLDFPNTNAQTSSDLTISVTGATTGKPVMLGVPTGSILNNSSYSAWVSAADTVTVRFNNYSSGAQDPPSGTFRVYVNNV